MTHTHTHTHKHDENFTSSAYAGGSNTFQSKTNLGTPILLTDTSELGLKSTIVTLSTVDLKVEIVLDKTNTERATEL